MSEGRRTPAALCALVLGIVVGVLLQRGIATNDRPCPVQYPAPPAACPPCDAADGDALAGLQQQLRECKRALDSHTPPPPAAPPAKASKHRPEVLKTTNWRSIHRLERSHVVKVLGKQVFWDSEYRNGPDSVLLLRHKSGSKHHASASDPFGACSEVGVVVVSAQRPGSCLVVSETSEKEGVSHIVERFCRGEGTNKCKAAEGQLVPAPRPSIYGSHLPSNAQRWKAQKLIQGLLQDLETVSADLRTILRQINRKGAGVTVMTTNMGDMELLLNWRCSALAKGIDISNVLVIASDETSRAALAEVGMTAVHFKAFGSMPENSAKSYGDKTFGAMMWMKVISVWLVARLGFNVLFQDADLVWFKDPWDYLKEKHAGDDTVWMDDSARSERFGPYYANSGFYFVRDNDRGLQFAQELVFHTDQIITSGSHQAVAASMLADGRSRYALRVGILDPDQFASGAYFHYRIDWMRSALLDRREPYVFHMCWTKNKEEKITFLKVAKWWWLKPACQGKDCCLAATESATAAWEAYKELRFKLDKRTVESRMEQDKKSRLPYVAEQ
eukprot:TRINITY_DN2669_c1_g1_i1.p1 TRINITY_DN2669_c1_g1~~TRINITY_DN2669_c1_g1_i1.p1  ORF type:complete len:558 (+),score=61.05 TRINITY_DN2669_c1_g1_i1:101-1774(+)